MCIRSFKAYKSYKLFREAALNVVYSLINTLLPFFQQIIIDRCKIAVNFKELVQQLLQRTLLVRFLSAVLSRL